MVKLTLVVPIHTEKSKNKFVFFCMRHDYIHDYIIYFLQVKFWIQISIVLICEVI